MAAAPDIQNLADRVQEELVGRGMPPRVAKLYSQHTRLRANQPGLSGWRHDEAAARLDDAVQLIHVALLKRESGNLTWRDAMRRAGELLEWLAHPELNPDGLPLRLLAAAAYQLAGYPARSSGLLDGAAGDNTIEDSESALLRALLAANFPELLRRLAEFWAQPIVAIENPSDQDKQPVPGSSDQLHRMIVTDTASALGVLCAEMRWGNEPRLQRALAKLEAVAQVVLHGTASYSWLLAKLCAQVAQAYANGSLRRYTAPLLVSVNSTGALALERYLRHNYRTRRALAWPSQAQGIERLARNTSFALCTPTGSGKTTVAELAILQSLFPPLEDSKGLALGPSTAPLAMYLVPSRALGVCLR